MSFEAVIGLLTGLPEQHAPLLWAKAGGWLGSPATTCQRNGDDAAANGASSHLPDEQVCCPCQQLNITIRHSSIIKQSSSSNNIIIEWWRRRYGRSVLSAPGTPAMLTADSVRQVELSPAQLDVLAILFTCIKVLYVGGAVGRAYQLIKVSAYLLN